MLAAAATDLGITADDDALAWVAKEATGSLRDAYTLFDQVVAFSEGHLNLETIHAKLGLLGLERLNALMSAAVQEQPAEALEIVDQALQSGVAVERFAMDLADYLRTLLLISAGIEREAVLGMRPDRIPTEVRGGWDRPRIEFANELVLQLYRDLRYSVNQRFDLELAISRLASLTSLRTPQALVRDIQALQEELVHDGAYHARHGESADQPVSSGSDADDRQGAPGQANPAAAEAPADEADIDPNEPPEVEGISLEQVQAIVARFRTQRISVAALLARL